MTHKIEFPLNGTTRTAEINYATSLSLGDVITIFPELTEESKALFTSDELIQLSKITYTPDSVKSGGIVVFKII